MLLKKTLYYKICIYFKSFLLLQSENDQQNVFSRFRNIIRGLTFCSDEKSKETHIFRDH